MPDQWWEWAALIYATCRTLSVTAGPLAVVLTAPQLHRKLYREARR